MMKRAPRYVTILYAAKDGEKEGSGDMQDAIGMRWRRIMMIRLIARDSSSISRRRVGEGTGLDNV